MAPRKYNHQATNNKPREKLKGDEVVINPLHSVFDNTENTTTKETSLDEWLAIFPQAALFTEYDDVLFEQVITMVYRNLKTDKISTKSITKFGVSTYDNMRLNHSSRFWPACENLLLKYQKSNVRRSLAISNLKNSNKLLNHPGDLAVDHHLANWDETDAGNLANQMKLMQGKSPEDIGKKLLQLGILQQHHLNSYGMDVVYDNSMSQEIVLENNSLVYLLGEQLDHLFDPLLEYSPEKMSFVYTPPQQVIHPKVPQTKLITSIVDELVSVQANFTWKLVDLLQNFIVPLRASVLSSNNSSSGITKVNQIFPPTIDEITRINRILNEAILTARSINYVEVLKAVGNILPYFYKPFVRHEANLKDFYQRLCKFANNNKNNVFENPNINKNEYSVREIDGIVTGSLMELPRLKLILKRLHEAVIAEELKVHNFEYIDSDGAMLQMYYDSAIQVIDAFGGQDEGHEDEEHKERQLKQRVFTPTGKILTELATNWPAELQYGWLSRKVVGIFELRNVKPDSVHASDTLIIFSDHLLFLTIVDNQRYLEEEHSDGVIKKISVSDVLMHSLVNEKPLPNLDSFPAMEVTAWCTIEDVVASGYTAVDDNDTPAEYIRFLNTSSSGFKSLTSKKHFTRNYHLEHCKSDIIIDLIYKARLLHKSSPFHLFKSIQEKLKVYYTAHDRAVYEKEISQSPFVLFLNMKIDVPEYFKMCPNLQLLLLASFIDDKKIQITGFEKSSHKQLNEFVSEDQFQDYLQQKVTESFHNIFQTYNDVTKNVIRSNADSLRYVANGCTNRDEIKLLDQVKYAPKQKTTKEQTHHKHKSSEPIMIPEAYMEKVEAQPKPDHKQPIKKRKSICDLFKKKEEGGAPLVISHPVPQPEKPGNPRNVSQTFIPKGHENEYVNTLRPIPTLHQIAQPQEHKRIITPESVVHHEQQQQPVEDLSPDEKGTTDASAPSIDVLPDFKFPPASTSSSSDPILLQEVEYTAHKPSPATSTTSAASTRSSSKRAPPATIKRIATIDSNRIHLKRKSSNFKAEQYKTLPIGIIESPSTSDISTPNWEAISASRNSSLRLSYAGPGGGQRDASLQAARGGHDGSGLRNRVMTNSGDGREDEEVARRVIDIATLRQSQRQQRQQQHEPHHQLQFQVKKFSSTPQRGPSTATTKTMSSTFSVKRTSTAVTTPQSLKSPYFRDTFFTTNATAAIFAPPAKQPPSDVPREDSLVSLSPLEVAHELAQFIDGEFGSTSPVSSPEQEPASYHANVSAITLTSTSEDGEEDEEEEFYSPNEEPNLARNTSQSESSEATVTSNRFIVTNESSKQSVVVVIDKEDSVAQLSAFLEKTMNF
ncbi:Bud site selection protein 3 [Candida viswanathii]|uniref:Bud site selection protein 3 n=1 Tax=Candida viswanathii TaxID=5486 RepID=A0A367YI94_9ASCO|nr:Bud site selection protein 3 [Candida viswanathii]